MVDHRDMRVGAVPTLAALLGIASCAHQAEERPTEEIRPSADSEQDELDAETEKPEDERSNGAIEAREKSLVLEGMVVPVIVGQDPNLVQTLELGFERGQDPSIVISISPKRVRTDGWKYLKCHEVGLLVADDWSAGGAKGSDGSWLRIEAIHDGSLLEGGSTVEHVTFNVDPATVREWALARDSGGQICFDKFSLSPEQKTKILEFLDTPGG